VNYQIIEKSQSEEIAKLAVCLTNEIIERTGIKHFDVDVPLAIRLCDNYVSNGLYNVIAAYNKTKLLALVLCVKVIPSMQKAHSVLFKNFM
jgi:hypothetical protein